MAVENDDKTTPTLDTTPALPVATPVPPEERDAAVAEPVVHTTGAEDADSDAAADAAAPADQPAGAAESSADQPAGAAQDPAEPVAPAEPEAPQPVTAVSLGLLPEV